MPKRLAYVALALGIMLTVGVDGAMQARQWAGDALGEAFAD